MLQNSTNTKHMQNSIGFICLKSVSMLLKISTRLKIQIVAPIVDSALASTPYY